MSKQLSVVILAAGEGTRMKSATPKVLHRLGGRPLIKWVLSCVSTLKPQNVFMVVGHGKDRIQKELAGENIVFIEQKKQLGSGHALQQAEKKLKSYKGDILVLCGDVPLLKPATLRSLLNIHKKQNNAATVLSSIIENPYGYGRISRFPSGQVRGIVEEKDANEQERAVKEVNSGIYCFSSPVIWGALKKVKPDNRKKEYYLTDVISILNQQGKKTDAYPNVGFNEMLGINTRIDLSRAEKTVRLEILADLMLNGVTVIDPDNTYISKDTKVGMDTVIYPGTFIEGKNVIGKNCSIGPNTFIKNSAISDDVEIISSHINSVKILQKVKIGPYAHLRPGTVAKAGSKIGNFSETKNAVIGEGSKVNHLSYIGDTFMGKNVNVGAGTITCNYDGFKKHKTVIGDRSFVGSNVNFVAPVKIGADALIAAGSTVTENVPKKALVIARSRQINKVRKNK